MKQSYKFSNRFYLFYCLLAVLLTGCKEDDQRMGEEEGLFSLSVRAASSSINEDTVLWEDRVDELRMLVFDATDGQLLFNEKLYFPNGFTSPSKAVKLSPGLRNFYFIANETVYNGDFVAALQDIRNESDFSTDVRFRSLPYDPAFVPDETSVTGRFVMSAVYTGLNITAGGTVTNPALLPVPSGRVELIRALAKVEVIFRKKVSGSTVPVNTITSVLLDNIASDLSAPPMDDYYTGLGISSLSASLDDFDYERDSIGSVLFYIPEFLVPESSTGYTLLEINNRSFPIETDDAKIGITEQRRSVPALSVNSVIRNYHYRANVYIDGEGGLQLRTYVVPWRQDTYIYLFQGDQQIVVPPIIPTDTSIIITTECGKIEILSHNEQLSQGLQGAYNDTVVYYDPVIQGPTIKKGAPPYYCEKKYGPGWRLINSCELLSFLAVLDEAYNVWTSNTWLAAAHPEIPYYPLRFRQLAQTLLERLTGIDLSASVLVSENNWTDQLADEKLDIIDRYFTPGDIMVRISDFPGGWPFEAPPGTDLDWFYNQVSIQVKAYWYDSGYLSPSNRDNWDTILYGEFERYDYSSTVSRCVREVE